jgi:hypothetical protein
MSERKICNLHFATGRVEACPEGACAFWEDGGAVRESGCAIERLGFDSGRRDLAGYLLELRTSLEEARGREEARLARATFAQLVPPDLSGR